MAITYDLSHRFEGESVGRALALLGERWTLLILREAFFGVRRYGQLARNLNIPRPTLSSRLRTLVDAGLLERVPYARDPDRYEYRLTDAGRDLFPAIVTLMRWGDEHLAGPEGPPIVLRHDALRGNRRPAPHLPALRPGDRRPRRHARARAPIPRPHYLIGR